MNAPATSDADGLAALERGGADLSTLHRFVFRLRFPDAKSAAAAVPKLQELAFETERERGSADASRVVRAAKRMYPSEPDLRGLRDKLDVIAAEGDGRYEGWTATAVVPTVSR